MNLKLLNPTELMIYNEGVRDGVASVATKKETEMNSREELLADMDLMRTIEDAAYRRGLSEDYGSPVIEFHEAFGHPVKTIPEVPDLETRMLRVKLLVEEVLEFARASGVGIAIGDYNAVLSSTYPDEEIDFFEDKGVLVDIIEAADALTDIRYVTDGALLCWGFPQNELLAEVHRSNMSKLGEDGMPIIRGDGKIMKGPNFTLPDIRKILIEAGWNGEEK